jgi:hypothetical protein
MLWQAKIFLFQTRSTCIACSFSPVDVYSAVPSISQIFHSFLTAASVLWKMAWLAGKPEAKLLGVELLTLSFSLHIDLKSDLCIKLHWTFHFSCFAHARYLVHLRTTNNKNSTVYTTVFINLGYTTCFNPSGSPSGVSSYTLFIYWIATRDSHIPIYIHRSWSGYTHVYLHTIWGYWLLWDYCINLTFKLQLLFNFQLILKLI